MMPLPPIFDPARWILMRVPREDLYKKHQEIAEKTYTPILEYRNTWIDHQNYK